MIFYERTRTNLHLLLQWRGSVFPRSFLQSLPFAAAAVALNLRFFDENYPTARMTQAWFAYSFFVSFLIVFRTQQAYSRYWEGCTLLHVTKGNWLNAMSCVVAFCTTDNTRADEVEAFQHLAIKLMSLLYCSALQQVARMGNSSFDVINLEGIEAYKMEFLANNVDTRSFILLQWLQRLIIQGMNEQILTVAPPIMTRIFQQLGDGYTDLINAQKISDLPFPFPYAQMITILLAVHSIASPFVCALSISDPFWAGALTCLVMSGFWSINFIAAEIEEPFGDDANDLPIPDLQKEMNRDLKILLNMTVQEPPRYHHLGNRESIEDVPCSDFMLSSLSDSGFAHGLVDERAVSMPKRITKLVKKGKTRSMLAAGARKSSARSVDKSQAISQSGETVTRQTAAQRHDSQSRSRQIRFLGIPDAVGTKDVALALDYDMCTSVDTHFWQEASRAPREFDDDTGTGKAIDAHFLPDATLGFEARDVECTEDTPTRTSKGMHGVLQTSPRIEAKAVTFTDKVSSQLSELEMPMEAKAVTFTNPISSQLAELEMPLDSEVMREDSLGVQASL